MYKEATALLSTLLRRLRSFLQDFLPANNLQLLFLLSSLVLYVGASYPWLPPGHALYSLQYQHQDGTLWFDLSTRFLVLRYYAILYAVQFSFIGSLALWCLPARNLWRKFAGWVLLPGGLAVTWFTAIVLLSRPQPPSLIESPGQILQDDLRPFLGRLLHLGTGFYITLLGMALCAVALRVAAVRGVPLPIRFQESAHPPQGSAREEIVAPRLFVLVVVTTVVAAVVEMGIFAPTVPVPGAPLPWYDAWPHFFAAWQWLPDLLEGLVVAACAIFLFRPSRQTGNSQRKRSIRLFIPVAVLVPLSIPVVPRLILKAIFTFSTLLSNVPYEFLGLGAFPWVLMVFVIAALQEFTLRACLQNRLESRFGFRRACLLIALLWWLLPLSSGFGPFPGLRMAVPGLSVVVHMLVLILYNVPLAWLWSRTRSLWLVSVMHGTILLFRAGDAAHTVYFTFRWLYWVETAAWVFVTFCLFKKFPIVQSDASLAPASD
ncbi:MAG TPA: CPBP family glutamic-type intramembrane protease [Candidatus Acidoferrales bacterium]|jgi:membrane protease YdiL (CAAX protease family)|nr:CPBP family glutamic-type intramembrane protease [Candidatus Acidoferrales bacterium]